MTEQFDEVNERLGKAYLKATFFSSITNPSTRFVNSLVYTGVGIAGAFAVINGSLTVGQLSSFLSYAISIQSRSMRFQAWSRNFKMRLPVQRGFLT